MKDCQFHGCDFWKNHGKQLVRFASDYIRSGFKDELADKVMILPVSGIYHFESSCLDTWDSAWSGSDHYAEGYPFHGLTEVFYCGNVCWHISYRGAILPIVTDKKSIQTIGDFLMEALFFAPGGWLTRGPQEHHGTIDGLELSYLNQLDGDNAEFSGRETIHTNGIVVYQGRYHGGLLNLIPS